jgi:hypothetical protein
MDDEHMSTATNYCSNCGEAFEPMLGNVCRYCALPQAIPRPSSEATWGVGSGILTWIVSVALLLGTQMIAMIIYVAQTGAMPKPEQMDWLLGFLLVVSVFPAHLLTLLFCWLVVTARGERPFLPTLGWGWHPQFKLVHAAALALLMMGVAIVLSKVLPHQETEFERMLKLGTSIRVLTALLAIFSAPLIEEVVYRGVLYQAFERKFNWLAGAGVVTSLFALVHVPQYWGSWAAIVTILLLSLVLTVLRAATGSLLPSVVTHFVFNGIQAVVLLLRLDDSAKQESIEAAWLGLLSLCGMG